MRREVSQEPRALRASPAPSTENSALDTFWHRIAAFRLGESEAKERLTDREAGAALYHLAIAGVAPEAASEAARAVLLQGRLSNDADRLLRTFASSPRPAADRVFSLWTAEATALDGDDGRNIGVQELKEGLAILERPELSARQAAAARFSLRDYPLSVEAAALLHPSTTGDFSFDVDSVYGRFRSREENLGRTEAEVRLLFYAHALTRHTGKTDAEILARLEAEPQIRGSGAFTDEATTFRVVAASIRENLEVIAKWMKREPTLSLRFIEHQANEVIGRDLERGESAVHDSTRARVVLQKLDNATYRLVTAHPLP